MAWTRKPTKYIRGPQFTNMNDLITAVFSGEYIYLHYKPQHPAVIKNMTVATLEIFVRGGSARYAIPNPALEKK